MMCHFLISSVFKLGKAVWYCVTKPEGQYSSTCIAVLLVKWRFSVTEFYSREVFRSGKSWSNGIYKLNLQKILLLLSEFPVATDEIPGRIETTVLHQNLHFNHARNPHCWRFMETGDISNEEAEDLLSDEKIVTRKQSKADSVARKSNVNSDENVNQLAEVQPRYTRSTNCL